MIRHCVIWELIDIVSLNSSIAQLIQRGLEPLQVPIAGQIQTQAEPGQDTNYLDRNTSAVGQGKRHRVNTSVGRFSTILSDFGFIVDSQLIMSDHVALLDYCNSLLTSVFDVVLMKLQSAQNAAAHLINNEQKFDHITPVLRELLWLPFHQRIFVKTAMPVYKCLHGWRLHNGKSFVDRFQLFGAVDSCGLAPPAFFTSREQRHPLVAEVLRPLAQSYGTVYLLSWDHSNCRPTFRLLLCVWRLISSTVIDCSLQCICCYLVSNLRCV